MFRVRTVISGGTGGPYLSTFYFDETDGGATPATAVAATVDFWNNIKSVVWSGLVMRTEPEVGILNDGTGVITGIVSTSGGSATGSDGGVPAPWATQGLIRWHCSDFPAGREVRGRTFIPGVTENNNQDGVPTSGYLSTCQTAANTLLAETDAALMIFSRKNHDTFAVLSGSPWAEWASLRSRRD